MRFTLKVYRVDGGLSSLNIDAADVRAATADAERQGYRVISARQKRTLTLSKAPFSVELFTQELLGLLDAGLSLIETVDILGRKARKTSTHAILDTLALRLREGRSFSQSLESMPETFPALFVATVRTSERTGQLTEALRRYLAYHHQLNMVRDKVVAASVYPLLLMSVGFLVVLFLLGYVVPRFSLVYEDMGRELPFMSRILMAGGQFIVQYGWYVLVAGIAAGAGAVFTFTRPGVQAAIGRILWSIPVLGERIRLYQLARFTRTLAMLVSAGIAFVAALDMVEELLGQRALKTSLSEAARLVREGRTASDAFAATGLATDIGIRLLAVGERSGELSVALERIATLYDSEISRWVDWFTKLFEPLLMIVIGLVIGIIVVLMYLPIFELAGSLQ
ncbi:MAG: type II secretion system F family protein [Pseudomonadota bacterium]